MKKQIAVIDYNEFGMIAACIADTIIKPLYRLARKWELYGYIGTLNEISDWATEFYEKYHEHIQDWDAFEESEKNIYNVCCWDDFLIRWTADRFKKFKFEHQL
jgi:hypothetical protein